MIESSSTQALLIFRISLELFFLFLSLKDCGMIRGSILTGSFKPNSILPIPASGGLFTLRSGKLDSRLLGVVLLYIVPSSKNL